MSALQNPVLDICSHYRGDICASIFDILGAGRSLRARLAGLGVVTATSPVAAGPAMGLVTFPLGGDLSHITTAQQLVDMIASLEALETVLATPFSGVVPIAAFASFRG